MGKLFAVGAVRTVATHKLPAVHGAFTVGAHSWGILYFLALPLTFVVLHEGILNS